MYQAVHGRRAHLAAAGVSRCGRTALMLAAGFLAVACSGGDAVTGLPAVDGAVEAKSTGDGGMFPIGRSGSGKTFPGRTPPAPSNPLTGVSFYLDPYSNARRQADQWRATRPADADQMEKIAQQPQASWLGDWLADAATLTTRVKTIASAAASQGSVPVFVIYRIPDRDCGGFAAGGAATATAYREWINTFVAALDGSRAVVVVEPDALAGMGCLSTARQEFRIELLRYAVQTVKAAPGVTLYLDAGHAAWQPAAEMARRLLLAGIEYADGFALNVSNFVTTSVNTSYGLDISVRVGGKHFVIDTGRNGLGPTADFQWCNPDGRALGIAPTTFTANPVVDAYLWLKPPGESDGTCNGGPSGGVWWPEYALGLAQRS